MPVRATAYLALGCALIAVSVNFATWAETQPESPPGSRCVYTDTITSEPAVRQVLLPRLRIDRSNKGSDVALNGTCTLLQPAPSGRPSFNARG
jgi:hypothetical protein